MPPLVPFLISYAMGGLLVAGLFPRFWKSSPDLIVAASLAGPFGLSLGSCAYFLSLLLGSPEPSTILLIEFSAAALLGAWAWERHLAASADAESVPSIPERAQPPPRSHLLALLAIIGLAAFSAAACAYYFPHGGWDAWASWNMRARFLVRLGSHWRATFSGEMWHVHANYPLLLTASVARGWTYAGSETKSVPVGVAAIFLVSAPALLGAALAKMGRAAWPLAVAGLLATPLFVTTGVSQIADVPLSFFYLAALWALAAHAGAASNNFGFASAAGFAAASAAWTKNEGTLFFLVAAAFFAARLMSAGEPRPRAARSFAAFLAGAAPAFAALLWFKLAVAPENDLVAAQGAGATLARLADPVRYAAVAKGIGWAAGQLGFDWTGAALSRAWLGSIPVLLPILWYFTRDRSPEARAAFRFAAGILGLTLAGYLVVYLMTPYDIAWHMRTSFDRLLLHLWPAAIFAAFASMRASALGASDNTGISSSRRDD